VSFSNRAVLRRACPDARHSSRARSSPDVIDTVSGQLDESLRDLAAHDGVDHVFSGTITS